jgi:molecular chaperone IbpA
MTTFDLSPFYRSTVGFDRFFSLLDRYAGDGNGTGYPPYNIERTGENAYRITMAVAGFAEKDLSLEVKEGVLYVRGERRTGDDGSREVLYRGIAGRGFDRRFQLADYVEVRSAALENGLLHIDLQREVPEAMRPKTIPISTSGAASADVRQINAKAA